MSKSHDSNHDEGSRQENAALKRKKLSDADQDRLLELKVYPAEQTQQFLKPGPGMEKVAPKVFDQLDATPEVAKALELDTDDLRVQCDKRTELGNLEDIAWNLYRRAKENRMKADSDSNDMS